MYMYVYMQCMYVCVYIYIYTLNISKYIDICPFFPAAFLALALAFALPAAFAPASSAWQGS